MRIQRVALTVPSNRILQKIFFIVAHFDGMGDYFFMYFIISKIAIKSKKVIILSIRHPLSPHNQRCRNSRRCPLHYLVYHKFTDMSTVRPRPQTLVRSLRGKEASRVPFKSATVCTGTPSTRKGYYTPLIFRVDAYFSRSL